MQVVDSPGCLCKSVQGFVRGAGLALARCTHAGGEIVPSKRACGRRSARNRLLFGFFRGQAKPHSTGTSPRTFCVSIKSGGVVPAPFLWTEEIPARFPPNHHIRRGVYRSGDSSPPAANVARAGRESVQDAVRTYGRCRRRGLPGLPFEPALLYRV